MKNRYHNTEIEENTEENEVVGKRVLSFDIYFQILRKRNSKIAAHHKAAMKKYAEKHNLDQATEEEFDRIFKRY